MASRLLQCVIYTNFEIFVPIISNLKKKELYISTPSVLTSWSSINDRECLFELMFYFEYAVKSRCISDDEILGDVNNVGDGFTSDILLESLSGSIHHFWMGIDEEREFYVRELYIYISQQLKEHPYFGYA